MVSPLAVSSWTSINGALLPFRSYLIKYIDTGQSTWLRTWTSMHVFSWMLVKYFYKYLVCKWLGMFSKYFLHYSSRYLDKYLGPVHALGSLSMIILFTSSARDRVEQARENKNIRILSPYDVPKRPRYVLISIFFLAIRDGQVIGLSSHRSSQVK